CALARAPRRRRPCQTSCASSSIWTLPFKAVETGQPSFVAWAIAWNFAGSTLGTAARVRSIKRVIFHPSPCFSIEQSAFVSSLVGSYASFANEKSRVILKQSASAAASNSSGLEPSPFSHRQPHLDPPSAPVRTGKLPCPL